MSATTTEPTAADKEAQEYWGYLFKPDKTGTDKLKNLLRGLYSLVVCCFARNGVPTRGLLANNMVC